MSVSERAREGGGERRVVIAGERRCVGVTRRVCEYASRQCKIVYVLYWRNRHRSAPARSGYGHHVKCGSCDMPLRSAAGAAQVGRLWSVQDGAFVSTGRTGGAAAVAAVGEARARGLSACCLRAWESTRGRG